jgi:hypothetical protein
MRLQPSSSCLFVVHERRMQQEKPHADNRRNDIRYRRNTRGRA